MPSNLSNVEILNILLDGNKDADYLNKSVSNLFTNWIHERK